MKHTLFISVLSLLMLVALGCGLLNQPSPTAEPTKPPAPTKEPAPTKPPAPTKAPEPTETPEPGVELGEEIRSEDGGYSFRAIPGFEVEEDFGITSMQAPDADPDLGPAIMMMGYEDEESATPEELLDTLTTNLDTGVVVSPPRKIDVDGKPGLVADVSGSVEAGEIAGRIVVVAVTANHHFVIAGAAPADEWEEFAPLFDAVLASVRFFPPAGTEEPPAGEVMSQWAISAEASSEYGAADWSADQATGAPDTPDCGDYTTAWASSGYDTVEWIELEYDTPVWPVAVNIFQTYNPNQVVKVELRDVFGDYHTVYEGDPVDESARCPFTLYVPVDGADYQVVAVKITIDQSVLQNWSEIDAVELVGVTERPGGD